MATHVEGSTKSVAKTAEQRRRAEAVRRLLAGWLANDSGYDEHAWPELKRGLEESRSSSRPLFGE